MEPWKTALLEGLNPRQVDAVSYRGPALLIVAGAGSGKTSVLTRRIASLIAGKEACPSQILAITFTNKAAGEMRERVEGFLGEASEGMWISTFHSACVRILRTEAERFGYTKAFTIYDSGDQRALLKRIIRDRGSDRLGLTPANVSSKMSRLKNELVDVDGYRSRVNESDPNDMEFFQVWGEYQAELARSQAFDFDDLIVHTVHLFRVFPEVAAVYRRRFRHVLIDEYQDTNHAQYALIRELTKPVPPELVPEGASDEQKRDGISAPTLTVVGDSDQSIYAFRGADIRNIIEFERDFPGAEVVLLEQNYRSKQNILDAANAVISHNFDRKAKNLFSERGAGDPIVGFTGYSQHDEAQFVVDQIQDCLDKGHSLSEIAIFYRTNAQSRVLEQKLNEYAIPHRLIGATSFYQREEIKDMISYLQVLVNPSDELSLRRIVNKPPRGIGEATIASVTSYSEREGISLFDGLSRAGDLALGPKAKKAIENFVALMTEFRSSVERSSAAEILSALFDRSGMRAQFEEKANINRDPKFGSKTENVEELIAFARELKVTGANGGDAIDFLTTVSLSSATDELDQSQGFVSLMTLHTAKGLEFETVFLTGLEEGLLPHAMSAIEPGGIAEERRLLYVGMTRAKELLFLTLVASRMTYSGEFLPCIPSRFLQEIPAELIHWKESGLGAQALERPRRSLERETPSLPQAPRKKNTQWSNRVDLVPRDNSGLELAAGDRIVHDDFGEGSVVALSGEGPKRVAEVHFDQVGKKRLLVKIAPISRVE